MEIPRGGFLPEAQQGREGGEQIGGGQGTVVYVV